ncbi:MAG: LolA family protein [Candidatus Binataceae bacterium]
MRAALALVCAAIVALASASHADVAAVWPSLAPGSTLYGRFIQEQYLKGLTAPLKTEGDFVVVPARGIIWRSAQPVRSVTVITAAGMRRIIDDNEVQRLASAKTPAFAHMYELLDRAIVGDWSALRQDFAVTCSGDRNAWRVILTPLDAAGPLAARLTSVVLTGDGRIDTVDINRANGDSEHVAFLNQVVSSTPLAEPDAHLLNDKWE